MKAENGVKQLFSLFLFVIQSHCTKNNVCVSIQDYYSIEDNPNCWYEVAADSNVTDIIVNYGYPVETHKVVTDDGYILTMFRIPNNQGEIELSGKHPVFLQHGWLASAANFVGLGKDSLAFLLADAGYDVWLGNTRGSEYSDKHVNLTYFDKQYWTFSVDEISLYDIPAQLDYVAQITGHKGNITYIGHSLGGTIALMYSSWFPTIAKDTIKSMILLAPAAHLANVKSPLFKFLRYVIGPLMKIIDKNDLIRLVSHAKVIKPLIRVICFESPTLMQRCIQILNLLVAGAQNQMDAKTLPVALNQMPGGSSVKLLSQLTEMVMNKFRRNNYGLKNIEIYGTKSPPNYDLSKIQVPVRVIQASGDWAVTTKDTINLYNRLSTQAQNGLKLINYFNFNHFDFMFGRNAKSLVYNDILKMLDSNYVINNNSY